MSEFLIDAGFLAQTTIYPQVTFVDWINDMVPQVVEWPTSRTAPDLLTQPATCAVYLASINRNGGP